MTAAVLAAPEETYDCAGCGYTYCLPATVVFGHQHFCSECREGIEPRCSECGRRDLNCNMAYSDLTDGLLCPRCKAREDGEEWW